MHCKMAVSGNHWQWTAMNTKPKRLTLDEAKDELRCSKRTLYRWIHNGTISASKVGQKWLISRDTINRVCRANGNRSQPERRRNNAGRDSLKKFGV